LEVKTLGQGIAIRDGVVPLAKALEIDSMRGALRDFIDLHKATATEVAAFASKYGGLAVCPCGAPLTEGARHHASQVLHAETAMARAVRDVSAFAGRMSDREIDKAAAEASERMETAVDQERA